MLAHMIPMVRQPSTVNDYFYYTAMSSVFALLFLLAVTMFCLRELYHRDESTGKERNWLYVAFGTCILLLIAGELCLNYLVPAFYVLNRPADQTITAYKGAPYVAFLQSQAGLKWRVFGRDGFLFPNWSEGFDLFDVGSLDAMYYKKYFRFVQYFLGIENAGVDHDLIDRFVGTGGYQFAAQRQLRFLQLGSV